MKSERFTNGGNRDEHGKFLPGCRGGPGNPHSKKVAALRASFFRAVKASDVKKVVRKLVSLAAAGNVDAIELFFDRCFGKCIQNVDFTGDFASQVIIHEIGIGAVDDSEFQQNTETFLGAKNEELDR